MTPIKLSEMERLAKEATQGEWKWAREWKKDTHDSNYDGSMAGLDPEILWYGMDGEEGIYCPKEADSKWITTAQPLTISRLCEAIRIAHVALEFYKGNFDGRQGTKWNSDIFYYEDNCGYTTTQDESTAKEALTKINSLVDLS